MPTAVLELVAARKYLRLKEIGCAVFGLVSVASVVVGTGVAILVRRWWVWWNRRPQWGPPTPLSPRQRFQIRHRYRWSQLRRWRWRPAAIARRWRERRLTLRRGYATAVLADFNEHFDRIAADALRYHLPLEGGGDTANSRARFEYLIERLARPAPQPTPAEHHAMATWRPLGGVAPGYENFAPAQRMYRLTECPPAARAALASWHERERDWAAQREHARHEVIDVLEQLWT